MIRVPSHPEMCAMSDQRLAGDLPGFTGNLNGCASDSWCIMALKTTGKPSETSESHRVAVPGLLVVRDIPGPGPSRTMTDHHHHPSHASDHGAAMPSRIVTHTLFTHRAAQP